ncbi:hypothetical protein EMIHUDRAFT_212014 [Emiliania huxleyi CCMP1516]|uniref:ShKT domain-containing protein n=2 Tax=Emiliania huxleyi TaxID=2903 RepID=A0A0D3IS26_EMIH1|nr:hypothetical protein EMIHUDRAFT_212014 [Emiliania huxleyi CCMP1516]EOD14061.1 hypothetical protein EMIHUDRAFT_212014 [Emiliania huxleyi CCMP1516]|eukprot:XP_005766490.1 hypothetical protein EMIHUDRAFT_212014 [Emiliania huxleyi CCMP1516]
MLAALAVAALAAPAPSDLRESAINPKARGPIFAPAPAPCDAGFVPTCEQAKGFGLCDTTNSACDTTCVDEVKMTCPVTCSLSAEATSGHLEPDATPSDYSKHLPPAATAAICSTCADHPDLPCCHDHPHESDDRRRLQPDMLVLSPAGGADRCRGSEPSCGPAAARRRGAEQWDRCGFIPACRRWRFFAEILINLFVDKAVHELLLLDCAAEPAPRC